VIWRVGLYSPISTSSMTARMDGFERINVRTANFGSLLHLDGIPFIHEIAGRGQSSESSMLAAKTKMLPRTAAFTFLKSCFRATAGCRILALGRPFRPLHFSLTASASQLP
jgi:hypothetical protein